ncbi:corrinoid protein [Desulfatitalea alkaliphila]|uniref:Corrinoid protein n=1 Tax=Desulfatitalea alkaliphila TaxID=2929485 RepID=A0AA41UIR9_9BACT|nr:corrinoid protein [Desulfatitalea alkaliphila]MCJ8500399.1 corrinoid protein [Desulfatitalea alkaliphila]
MSFETLSQTVIKGDMQAAAELTRKALDDGADAQQILDQGLIAAMDVVGRKFAEGAMFVPQMLRSAKTMQQCVEVLKPHFQGAGMTTKGTIILGTVKGDLHDIGKNLVAMMLEGAGFRIVDLGVDVSPAAFVEAVAKENGQIVGMSALLSTTMPAMAETITALTTAGHRETVKIMIGGAPVTADYATSVGADCYAPDAGSAVTEAKRLLDV